MAEGQSPIRQTYEHYSARCGLVFRDPHSRLRPAGVLRPASAAGPDIDHCTQTQERKYPDRPLRCSPPQGHGAAVDREACEEPRGAPAAPCRPRRAQRKRRTVCAQSATRRCGWPACAPRLPSPNSCPSTPPAHSSNAADSGRRIGVPRPVADGAVHEHDRKQPAHHPVHRVPAFAPHEGHFGPPEE